MTGCPTCGAAVREGAKFCASCGTGLLAAPATCVGCGAVLDPADRFCSECGTPSSGGAGLAGAGGPVASRRVTSVLFGDLVGFTRLSEQRDSEEVRELLSRYFEECRRIVERYGGVVEKFIGDAVMAVWGVPTAHEDDAERAVRAGLELVNTVEAMGADVGLPDLAMRVGIVTGEVAVTVGALQQGMVAGDAVNTASRVQSAAAPGQVWVDETTRLLTSSAITYVDVGSHPLKGKADAVPLWSVRAVVAAVGGAQRADGLEAPHVGRDREMRLVKELFHGVEESGRPALLVVGAEPGVGKTRLGWEFFKYVDGLSRSVRWHSGRCLAYGEGVAFFALAEAVRARLQTAHDAAQEHGPREHDEQDDVVLGDLIRAGLERYVPDATEAAWIEPRLGALLGSSAGGAFAREDLFSAWATFLARVGEGEYPVVLMIDDAQHADDGLVTFLEYLLSVAEFPCFVVLLARPGLLEERPGLAGNRRATVLHLEPLPERTMGTLLDGLVVGLPEQVRSSLVERADGVPLFAVETVRSLIDKDLVVPRAGQYVLADPASLDLDAVAAPASLQALIAARLDTLTPDQRRVVDQASVVGDSFSRDLLEHLCPDLPDLDAALDALVRAQILRRESSRLSAEHGQYQFVQTVVRQVAHGTLSRRDRKTAHLRVVEGLLGDEERSDEVAAIVAQHYLAALDAVPDDPDHDDLAVRAVATLRQAADRAVALGSYSEAAGHQRAALTRVSDPVEKASLSSDLARSLWGHGEYLEARELAERAMAIFDELGDPVQAGTAAATLGLCLAHGLGDHEASAQTVRERYRALERVPGADRARLELCGVLAFASSQLGLLEETQTVSLERVALAERIGDVGVVADSYISLAIGFQNIGTGGLSRLLLESAAEQARELHDVVRLTRALVNLNASWNQDDVGKALALGQEAVIAAKAGGIFRWTGAAKANLRIAQWMQGDWDALVSLPDDGSVDDMLVGGCLVGLARTARDEAWRLPWEPGTQSDDSKSDAGWRAMGETAWALAHHDLVAAVRLTRLATEAIYEFTRLDDDFFLVLDLALDVAVQAGDRQALAWLVGVVEETTSGRLGTGVRAGLRHARAVLASWDGDHPDQVERDFVVALAEYDAWQAAVPQARCREHYGVWLTRQGRAGDAEPVLAAARATYEALGAARWLAELDAALAGAPAGFGEGPGVA